MVSNRRIYNTADSWLKMGGELMKNLQSNNRIAIFDYIKAVAMLLVIYNHCVIGTLHRNELGYPFFVMLPVPILMYLSGYTFSKSFEKYGGGGETFLCSILLF